MKILVIGQNPSTPTDIKRGSTMDRLADWMNAVDVETFHFTNACLIRGNNFTPTPDYDHINEVTTDYDKIIALGNFASHALSKLGITHFKLPHPSPLNRQINDPKFIEEKLKECKEYLCTT